MAMHGYDKNIYAAKDDHGVEEGHEIEDDDEGDGDNLRGPAGLRTAGWSDGCS